MIGMVRALIMAFLARASGGGFGAEKLDAVKLFGKVIKFSMLPEIFFAITFAATIGYQTGNWWVFALTIPWSYWWMETGHGVALPWGRPIPEGEFKEEMKAGRKQTLSPVVDFIASRLGIPTERIDGGHHVNYCRLFMAVKGLIIGLPAGGIGGLILFFLWPLSYELGVRFKNHALSEILTGVSTAVALSVYTLIF